MTPIETTAVVETSKTANGILNKLLGPIVEEWGAIISEKAKTQTPKKSNQKLTESPKNY